MRTIANKHNVPTEYDWASLSEADMKQQFAKWQTDHGYPKSSRLKLNGEILAALRLHLESTDGVSVSNATGIKLDRFYATVNGRPVELDTLKIYCITFSVHPDFLVHARVERTSKEPVNETCLRRIIEASPIPMGFVDRGSQISLFNKALEEFYNGVNLAGLHLRELQKELLPKLAESCRDNFSLLMKQITEEGWHGKDKLIKYLGVVDFTGPKQTANFNGTYQMFLVCWPASEPNTPIQGTLFIYPLVKAQSFDTDTTLKLWSINQHLP